MELGLLEGNDKGIHLSVFFGFGWMGIFKRTESDFLMIFSKNICVHTTIVYDFSIKELRSSQKDITSIYGQNITLKIILIVLPNGQGNETLRIDLHSLIVCKPLDSIRIKAN